MMVVRAAGRKCLGIATVSSMRRRGRDGD